MFALGSTCVQDDVAGECLPAGLGCLSDVDCDSGQFCQDGVYSTPSKGVWTNEDCEGKRCVKEVICLRLQKPVSESAVGECITPSDETTEPEGTESTERRAEKSFPLRAAQWMRIARRGLFA